jgi:hypothetical protein
MTRPAGNDDFEDLAADVVRRLQDEAKQALLDGYEPAQIELDELPEDVRPKIALFKKIDFSWKQEDKFAISQLRAAANTVFRSMFTESVTALEEFYNSIRVHDAANPGHYRRTETGAYVEDWSQLSGQDLIKAIFDLQRQKVLISPQISNLFLEASYAKQISTDVYWEHYRSLMEGTVGDRTARANQESKVDRYAAFFRYWIWHCAAQFQREIDGTMRVLEKMAEWQTRSKSLT